MQRKISHNLLAVALLAIPLCGFGCSGVGDDGRPSRYPVTGTVTMNGEPVANANVNFQLVDGSGSAVGVTDSQGRYELTSFVPGDGAVPGEYQVTVTKFSQLTPSPDVSEDDADYDPDAPAMVPENLLPERYANPATSELTATVTESPNMIDLELTD